jgi:hypothetical protein
LFWWDESSVKLVIGKSYVTSHITRQTKAFSELASNWIMALFSKLNFWIQDTYKTISISYETFQEMEFSHRFSDNLFTPLDV